MKLIHTADWQLGKPYARIQNSQKRTLAQRARLDALHKIADLAMQHQVDCVLVAGDAFDSPTADRGTVSAACAAIGQMQVPVYMIPGNHDHGGPGSIWNQDFFNQEQSQLAPNLHVVTENKPIVLEKFVLLPCPLMSRRSLSDPTTWLRDESILASLDPTLPRVALAHGSVQGFTSTVDEEDASLGASNLLNLQHLPISELDYIALGDWHGVKEVSPKSWYSGTPEPDRFPKGDSNRPGFALLVEVKRGENPTVNELHTASLNWHEMNFEFTQDSDLELLQSKISELTQNRVDQDLLKLELHGSLGIEASASLEKYLESLRSRMIRLKLKSQTTIAPNEAELNELSQRASDPLISSVAAKLIQQSGSHDPQEATTASIALRELFSACQRMESKA